MMKKIGIKEIGFLLIVSILLIIVNSAAILKDSSPEWKYYQSEFKTIIAEKFGSVDITTIPNGIQQIWSQDLNSVDRCVTCHQGVNWNGLEGEELPWSSHPKKQLLKDHPIENYGCTICHGGQGYALSEYEAHGFIEHWEEPLLGKTIGSEYDPRNPAPLSQINCNYCHRYERTTVGADFIDHAKALVRQKGCKICHIIN